MGISREALSKVKQLEIYARKIVNSTFTGQYHTAFRGQGIEFDEVREYISGDDVRSIDWKVTARLDQAHIKRFKEERELHFYILYDASASNAFGSLKKSKNEMAAEIGAVLAMAAIKNQDKVGLIVFTDKIEKIVPISKGKAHVMKIIRELLFINPSSKKTDIGKALSFLNKTDPKRGMVFLLSDMVSNDFTQPLQLISRKHDMTAIRISDPRERTLPAVGLVSFEDAETGELVMADTSSKRFGRMYEEAGKTLEEKVKSRFQRCGVDYLSIQSHEDYLKKLIVFFKKKNKARVGH